MTRYEMIMATAEHIERHPEAYNFGQGYVIQDAKARYGSQWRGNPDGDAVPHCMLARMGQLAGARNGVPCDAIAVAVLAITPQSLYEFIDGAAGNKTCAQNAARGLRHFAKRYEGIPGEVLAIFNTLEGIAHIPETMPMFTPAPAVAFIA